MGYEIDFLPVGDSNGDAICIRYGTEEGGFRIHVVDGGYTDTGKAIIDHIEKHYDGATYIDNVVLSHADADHVTGLFAVVEHFNVGTLWMNRPWIYAEEILEAFHGNYTVEGLRKKIRDAYPLLADLEDLCEQKGIPINEAFSSSEIGPFTVLAPARQRYLSLIPQFDRTPPSYAKPEKGLFEQIVDAVKALAHFFETWGDEKLEENPPPVSASNESCVVQFGDLDGHKVLLTADAGPIALNEAADTAEASGWLTPPNLIQVPHHGSRRNVTPSVLDRWLGGAVQEGTRQGHAICSVGKNKPEYPRKRVSNAFLRRGYPVYATRNGWICDNAGMPAREGMSPATAEQFASNYEE